MFKIILVFNALRRGRLGKAILFIETIRWLRPTQIYYRIFYKIYRPRRPRKQSVYLRTRSSRPLFKTWAKNHLTNDGKLCFLNRSAVFEGSATWNDKSLEKLWLYNLHYFDFLASYSTDAQLTQVSCLVDLWIKDNPFRMGNGWEPYPLSLRIVNWIKWFSKNPSHATAARLESLAEQVLHLQKVVEFHILGNHVFENAKALTLAGIFFEDGFSYALKQGCRILRGELTEQFLDDGAHFELSPTYHATVLWGLCELIEFAESTNCVDDTDICLWRGKMTMGLRWLEFMSHPDGGPAFFNDSAFGVSPRLRQVQEYVEYLGLCSPKKKNRFLEDPSVSLDQSGYCRIESSSIFVAIIDLAEIGPSYLPGHAHADNLSFELSLGMQRVFVNTGTSTYSIGSVRAYQRSTEAHNTVTIDGESSSEMWGSFRVARRANVIDAAVKSMNGRVWVGGSHDGYMRLPSKNIHSREFEFSVGGVQICDRISGAFVRASAFYHLHPTISIAVAGAKALLTLSDGREVEFDVVKGAAPVLLDGSWCPEFGVEIPNKKLRVDFLENEICVAIRWGRS